MYWIWHRQRRLHCRYHVAEMSRSLSLLMKKISKGLPLFRKLVTKTPIQLYLISSINTYVEKYNFAQEDISPIKEWKHEVLPSDLSWLKAESYKRTFYRRKTLTLSSSLTWIQYCQIMKTLIWQYGSSLPKFWWVSFRFDNLTSQWLERQT